MLVDQATRRWSALIGEELMLFGAASSSQAYVDSAQPRCNDWKALRRPRYAKQGTPAAVSLDQFSVPIAAAQQSADMTESPPLRPFPVSSTEGNFLQVGGNRWAKRPPAAANTAASTSVAAVASAPAASRPAVARPAALKSSKAKVSAANSPISNQETTSQLLAPCKPASSSSAHASNPAADSSSLHLPDSSADKTHRNARKSSNATQGKPHRRSVPQLAHEQQA